MPYYLHRIHHKFKKLVDVILNVGFVFLYQIYGGCRKKYLERKRAKHSKDDPNYQLFIDMEQEINTDSENLKKELKLDGKQPLPMSRTNKLINSKNKIRNWCTLAIVTIVYLFLFYYVMFFTYRLVVSHDNAVSETQDEPCNISWFHAIVGIKKYETFTDLKESYYDQLQQPCRPLDKSDIETNTLRQNGYAFDLTLLYHMLCHIAMDQSVESDATSIVIPKYTNISQSKYIMSQFPVDLFGNGSITDLYDTLPNVCVMAVATPSHHTDHQHWPFEKALDEKIPAGSFIHTSIVNRTNNTIATHYLNPIINASMDSLWKSIPTPGECAIMINPDVVNTKEGTPYIITHHSPILVDDTLFETHMTVHTETKYTALDGTHHHWVPQEQKVGIFLQVSINMLHSRNCMEESHDD